MKSLRQPKRQIISGKLIFTADPEDLSTQVGNPALDVAQGKSLTKVQTDALLVSIAQKLGIL